MKRAVLVVTVFLAATASTASAGGFVGLAIGGSPGVTEGNWTPDGRSGRLELGYSFGKIGVEGIAHRFDLLSADQQSYSNTTLALAGTFGVPLSNGFGVYGRLGIQHTSVTTDSPSRIDQHYGGGGLLVGGGADYKLPLAAANLSVFVDYTITTSSLTIDEYPEIAPYRFTTRNWMLGAKLSF
jgi:hypothetical protein